MILKELLPKPAVEVESQSILLSNIINELNLRYKQGKTATAETRELYARHLNQDKTLLMVICRKTGLSQEQVLGFFDVNRRAVPYEG
jgi:hypothetical protein